MSAGTRLKRAAKNAAKQTLYLAMWGEEAPVSKRKAHVYQERQKG